ncbi:hypothetical protein OA57_08850 [Chelonobacter oris]|uniref:Uncharacterized protein n=1 Tax=Chelonobacter oris TaxID=505317 RepID=A0A0A3B838_9PAST|nr:DUF5374 domain-containing protein [Chelonobacter oris]KGQ69744.1 hypothetical protein OA57_08850 [Chelonobacter oris]
MILIRYKRNGCHYRKGAGLVAVLFTLMLFSIMLSGLSRWLSAQQRDGVQSYQRYQALLLAQNQLARQRLGLECETQYRQNQLVFQIDCHGKQVKVRFVWGEVILSAEKR